MATNFIQDGDVIQWTNGTAAAVASGQLITIGNLLAVALVDIPIGATGSAAIDGVFSNIPKVPAAVFAQGEKLIWDVSAGQFDDSLAVPAAGDVTGGAIAWVAGVNGETTCTVKLTPGNTAVA